MFKAIIFDLDGTLADTVESIAYAGNSSLVEAGLTPRNIEEYKEYSGDGTEALIKKATQASGDHDGRYFDRVLKRYTEISQENCTYKVKPYEGITETLRTLRKNGLKLAVLTNKQQDRAVTVIEHLFGKVLFDRILGQSERFPVKPDSAGALYLAQQLECEPEQCMLVGDTEVDIETGKNARMYTVGVLWGFRKKETIEANKPNKIIDRPSDLIGLM